MTEPFRLRLGRHVPKNLYLVTGEDWRSHPDIGRIDDPEIAARIVAAVNAMADPGTVTVSREDLRAVLPVIDAHGSPDEDGAFERLRAAAGDRE